MAKAVTLKNANNEEIYPVTSSSLINGSIITSQIADGSITPSKLSFDRSIITVAGSGGDVYINGTTTISFDNVRNVYGTGLTFDSANHAVVIGAGISKVKVSSSIFYSQTSGGFYYSWYRLYVNGANPATGEFIGMTNVNASYGTAALAPALVDVSEGDKITLMNIDRGTIRGVDSYMTVEVVA